MKKWKLKAMKEAAKQLPQAKQYVKKSGADILKQDPLAKDKNGIDINPAIIYMVPAPKNTFRAVKKYFKKPENRNELQIRKR